MTMRALPRTDADREDRKSAAVCKPQSVCLSVVAIRRISDLF